MRKGQKHSEETKAKIAAAKLGKEFTREHSQAIAAALKGHKKTAAHKAAIAAGIKAAQAKRLAIGVDPAVSGTDTTVILPEA
jgi:hypothetical protein